MNPTIRLDPKDNVVVARAAITAGTPVPAENLSALQDVPAGHKLAVRFIAKGEKVLKYNTLTSSPPLMMGIPSAGRPCPAASACADSFSKTPTFRTPIRDGELPEISVLDSDCLMAEKFGIFLALEPILAPRGSLDPGLNPGACRSKWVIGYAAEDLPPGTWMHSHNIAFGEADRDYRFSQDYRPADILPQSERATFMGIVREANKARRVPCSAEHIKVGLQCGGSDGFSGLSANPALGVAMDLLVKNGGTAILSETSEIYGVEHTLTCRAVTPEVGQKLVDRMNWWLDYNKGRDTQINGRVSPGNNAGGLANVLEKSLGGAKKGGNSPLMAVYEYAHPVTQHGLVFMDTPGYDPVSATGQIAGGANLIAFTTGRGSCFGSVPAPTVKLASNTPMFNRMKNDMDLNCGTVIDGEATLQDVGQQIFDLILRTASGQKSKSEIVGMGENEFARGRLECLRDG